jgi:hypothetical protein
LNAAKRLQVARGRLQLQLRLIATRQRGSKPAGSLGPTEEGSSPAGASRESRAASGALMSALRFVLPDIERKREINDQVTPIHHVGKQIYRVSVLLMIETSDQ